MKLIFIRFNTKILSMLYIYQLIYTSTILKKKVLMHLTLANATLQLTFLVSHFLSFLSVCAWNYKKRYEPLITTLEKPLHEHKYKR